MAGAAEEYAMAGPGLDLQEFVKNATWRELLTELVEKNQLDPWDIDIVKVVDSYIGIVKSMRFMDLKIPANIMLAASILLRMKSDTINVMQVEEQQEMPEPAFEGRIIPEVPELVPRLRMQPKRRITLEELMDALSDAIKVTEKREIATKRNLEPINLQVDKDDIDDKMDSAYDLVRSSADSEGVTTFSAISKGFQSMESMLLGLFVPLLFLASNGRIMLLQDSFFNEIFIKLESDADGAKG